MKRRWTGAAAIALAAVAALVGCGGDTLLASGDGTGDDAADGTDADVGVPDEGPDDAPDADADADTALEDVVSDVDDATVEDAADDDADVPDCPVEPGLGPIPVPFSPENGTPTGSLWAAPDRQTLRPLFRWRWTPDGGSDPTFEVQVDDSCTTPGFASCCFPSPEAVATGLAGSTWRPDVDLVVDELPPVGRRYYWRVRACRSEGCSAWSDVRYLDVGRVRGDWNGDGHSDPVFGSPGWARAFVYLGGVAIEGTPDVTFIGGDDDGSLGRTVAYVGDVNADGFDDLIVGTRAGGGTGRAYLHLGSPAPDAVPDLALEGGHGNAEFTAAVAGHGDVTGDGFADFVVGEPSSSSSSGGPGRAYLYLGASAPDIDPDLVFLEGVFRDSLGEAAALGDLNGDGFADVLVAAPGYSAEALDYGPGYVYAYLGNAVPDADHDVFYSGDGRGSWFGGAISMGDLDGDGYADLLVGQPGIRWMGGAVNGRAVVFLGGVTPDAVADSSLVGVGEEHLGAAVSATGDVDGDGVSDILIGAPGETTADAGRVLFVRGGSGVDLAAAEVLSLSEPGDRFGAAVSLGADVDGDGRADVLIGSPTASLVRPGEVLLWLGRRASGFGLPADATYLGSVLGDRFGTAVD